jgi:hypothetical protein
MKIPGGGLIKRAAWLKRIPEMRPDIFFRRSLSFSIDGRRLGDILSKI